jgi:hypothetical protein
MLAEMVLITMPMDSSAGRGRPGAGLKRSSEASSITPRTSPSKMMGSTITSIAAPFAEARGHAEGSARHVGQQDLGLVDGALADQPWPRSSSLPWRSRRRRRSSRPSLSLVVLPAVAEHVELGLLRADHRRQFGEDQLSDRQQVLLACSMRLNLARLS